MDKILNKTSLLICCSMLLLTGCYQQINKDNLPKICEAAKDAVTAAEYALSQKFGNKIFDQQPYQFERNETNDTWIIRGFMEEMVLGGTYRANIRMTDCSVLLVAQEE